MSSISVTPGSGANVATVLDGSSVNHPVGVMEFLVSAAPTAVSASNPLPVSLAPATSGGLSTYSLASAATTNATVVKSSAGQVYGYALYNNTSSDKFVRLYNKATAPAPASDTPARRIKVPANGGVERAVPNGLQFSAGIAFVITGAAGDADTTAVAVNDIFVNIDYK